MKAVVPIKDIVSNPFQVRRHINKDSVRALAEEIKEVGLWPGALRGRMRNGKLQLCYGHRRLAALKILGYDEIEVDVMDLSDEDMTFQSLAENFQREGLTDIEKAEGIRLMLEHLQKKDFSESAALERTSRILGLSIAWIKDLLSLLKMEGPVQKVIREKKIAGRTALEAHRFGGKDMVETAMKHALPVHKISAIAQRVRQIPDEQVRSQIKKAVIKGHLTDPESVEEKARKMLKGRKPQAPANLEQILGEWEVLLKHWEEKLDDLLIVKRYLDGSRYGATIQAEARKLIKKLSRLG